MSRKRERRLWALALVFTLTIIAYLVVLVTRKLEPVVLYQPVYYEAVPLRYEVPVVEDEPYKELALPTSTGGEFKTYMDYRTITDKTSMQYALQRLAYTNEVGFRMFNGKYIVAVGTFYAKCVGKELRVTLENGVVFDAIVGDIKQDRHTDKNNQYIPMNGNIIEYIIDSKVFDPTILSKGNISPAGMEGKIVKIEEVIYE